MTDIVGRDLVSSSGGEKSVPARARMARSLPVIRAPDSRGRSMPVQYHLRPDEGHYRSKQERQSKQPRHDPRINPWGIIEPPYDLDRLVELLYDNPDYYRVVDQYATDVAGMGWDLIDAEDFDDPASANVPMEDDEERAAAWDAQATRERIDARKRLNEFGRDFQGDRIPLAELCKQVVFDKEATGEGYLEVARDPQTGLPAWAWHVHSRLVRKRWDGTFVQFDEAGREVAYFRRFGSDPSLESSRHTRSEASNAGVEEGELKNELVEFRRYHAAEVYYGVPPIVAALAAVRGNIYAEDRNVRFFFNRAMPEWLVEIRAARSTFNDDGSNAILDQYEMAILEHMQYILRGDDFRVLVLRLATGEVETKWEKLDSGLTDDQMLSGYIMRNRDVIVGVYKMLPHRIGIIETASLGSGTGESQTETYKRAQIDPRQLELEEFFDKILDEWSFRRVRFKLNEMDIVDEQREMQMFGVASASGMLSVNEEREWLSRIVSDQDFPPVDEDLSDIPKWLVEQQTAGLLGGVEVEGFMDQSTDGKPEPMAGLPAPIEEDLQSTAQASRTQMPPSMALAIDPAFARARREMAGRMRARMAERRRVLLAAGRVDGDGTRAAAPVAVAAGNGDGDKP